MRYKVEFEGGYASYDESEKEKAFALWEERGIRLYSQQDIFDEGTLIMGQPKIIDLSIPDRAVCN